MLYQFSRWLYGLEKSSIETRTCVKVLLYGTGLIEPCAEV